nr:MAG TPA: hypothetical protein [Caudoviricetes sp.]
MEIIINDLKNINKEEIKIDGLSQIPLIKGDSAYEVAVSLGFTGTEKEWLESMKYDDTKIKNEISNKVDKEEGKGLSTNDFTSSYRTKLEGISEGAQVNTVTGVKGDSEIVYRTGNINITKNNLGLGNVENKSSASIREELTKENITKALGYTPPTIDTNTKYGLNLEGNTLSLVENGNTSKVTVSTNDTTYTLTQDSTDKHKITLTPSSGTAQTITIPDNNTQYSAASQTVAGLMSAADKKKLDGIAEGANKTTDTNTTYTLTQDANNGHKITLTPSSGTAQTITIPDNNTEYSVATQTTAGLMSATDKKKLDGITGSGASTTVIDNLTSTSTTSALSANQGKVLNDKITNKVDKVSGKGLSTNDFTSTYKTKLDGIAKGANNTTVTDNLTSTSTTNALSANQGRILNNKILDYETVLEW